MSVPCKVFMRTLLNRIKPIVEEKLREEQAGFRVGKSTIDQIFTLRQIIEKKWEYAKPVFCAFVDLEKAYDSVWRRGMWRVAEHYSITIKIIRIMKNCYQGVCSCAQ